MMEISANETSSVKSQKKVQGFTAALSYAACEWFLLFLLLLDALLSYLLTEFANYCNLPAPCILCSRLDHVLGNAKPGYYRKLICSNHRSELSSLISCHIHGKLADGHGMCDDCLFSSTKKTELNTEARKLLMIKLGLVEGNLHSSLLDKDVIANAIISRLCTCCGKPLSLRKYAERLLTPRSFYKSVPKPKIPLPHIPGRSRLSRKNSLKKNNGKLCGSMTPPFSKNNCGLDTLSHFGHTELKITSESEPEFLFSEDDDVDSLICERDEFKNDPSTQCASPTRPRRAASEPPTSVFGFTNPIPSLASMQPNFGQVQDLNFVASNQINQKSASAVLPELTSVDGLSPPSECVDISHEESRRSKMKSSIADISVSTALSEFVVLAGTNTCDGVSPENSFGANPSSSIEHVSVNKHEEDLKNGTPGATSVDFDPIANDSSQNSMIDVTNKEREPHSVTRQTMAEVPKKSEEPILSPLFNCSLTGTIASIIPMKEGDVDEINEADASGSSEHQALQKSVSVETGLDFLDGGNVGEVDGKTLVDRLKCQIRYLRNCLNGLHKELEEERSASEVAVNEAMAMITRLQEEKSALHMEALHYLRMMEEQAEYDLEALEKANGQLAEKEKEIQDLEAELDFYRLNFGDESMPDDVYLRSGDSMKENITLQSG